MMHRVPYTMFLFENSQSTMCRVKQKYVDYFGVQQDFMNNKLERKREIAMVVDSHLLNG
jgi:hypothetical protein